MAEDRLIVALDHDDIGTCKALVETLGDQVGFYKIGLGLLCPEGLAFAHHVKTVMRKHLFLDLKLFDIASTVSRAVRNLRWLEPDFLTVHGDPHVVAAAVKGRAGTQTRILAVTVLTSLSRQDLDDSLHVAGAIDEFVCRRASRALDAGADGVICSAREAAAVRNLQEATDRLLVTPGIRLDNQESHDQMRVWTPQAALRAGADYLVVGRPICNAPDPAMAAAEFNRAISDQAG